ncbi:MAG: ATPase domain-containing protein [Candidatus Micrarchaeota archaeon]
MEASEAIKSNQVVLVVMPPQKYAQKLPEMLKDLGEANVEYVTLNKPHSTVLQNLKKSGVETKGFFFIDATGKKERSENCTAVDSPTDLIQLDITMFEIIGQKKPKLVVFDSITTLAIYNDEMSVLKFVHGIATKIRDTEAKLLLPCLGDESTLVKDSSMFVDAVVKIE